MDISRCPTSRAWAWKSASPRSANTERNRTILVKPYERLMHVHWLRRSRTGLALAAMLALAFGLVPIALAQVAAVKLFKIVTAKDEIEIGVTDEELRSFGAGPDIDVLAKKLADGGQMT